MRQKLLRIRRLSGQWSTNRSAACLRRPEHRLHQSFAVRREGVCCEPARRRVWLTPHGLEPPPSSLAQAFARTRISLESNDSVGALPSTRAYKSSAVSQCEFVSLA